MTAHALMDAPYLLTIENAFASTELAHNRPAEGWVDVTAAMAGSTMLLHVDWDEFLASPVVLSDQGAERFRTVLASPRIDVPEPPLTFEA